MVHGEGMNVFLDFQALTIEVAQENSQDALVFFFTGILPKDQQVSTIIAAYETRGEETLGTPMQHLSLSQLVIHSLNDAAPVVFQQV